MGTPGRLEELAKSGNLLLTNCRFYVLDEADGLLQQGHGDLINRMHGRMPKITPDGKRLQMIVCSATLHSVDVKKMAVLFFGGQRIRKCFHFARFCRIVLCIFRRG